MALHHGQADLIVAAVVRNHRSGVSLNRLPVLLSDVGRRYMMLNIAASKLAI